MSLKRRRLLAAGPETVRSGQCNDCTAQFSAFAGSQQFGQRYGWGSPLWSHRTQVYRQAAAQDGVIGDMNEGPRWDNSVPTVYNPNQAAAAQDLSYGVQQYQPGQDPSGELPLPGADDPQGYAELRSRVTTKVAYGERDWTPRGIHRIVDTGTVDVIGIDPGRCEGITGWLAAAAHVRTARREVNAHAWSSAIVTAASLALSFASPHCHQVEIKPLRNPMQHDLPITPITAADGRFVPPAGPGLGIDIDETVLERCRLTD